MLGREPSAALGGELSARAVGIDLPRGWVNRTLEGYPAQVEDHEDVPSLTQTLRPASIPWSS